MKDEYKTWDIKEMAAIAAITDRLPDRWEIWGRDSQKLIAVYEGTDGLPINGNVQVVYTDNTTGEKQSIPLLSGHDNFSYHLTTMIKLVKKTLKTKNERETKNEEPISRPKQTD